MREVALARELALLGAESSVLTPEVEVIDPHAGYRVLEDRWRALGERMRTEPSPGAPSLRETWDGDEACAWLFALCAAVELHPDAAAAMSLVAEDERVHLVTPAAFARLMRSALGLPYEDGLAVAVPGGPLERCGWIERAETAPGRPLTQQPVRLRPEVLRDVLRGVAPRSSGNEAPLHPPARTTAYPLERVEGARDLLREEGVLCLRSSSARAALQLALDLGTVLGLPVQVRTAPTAGVRDDAVAERSEGIAARRDASGWRVESKEGVLEVIDATAPRGFNLAEVRGLRGGPHPVIVLVPASADTLEVPTVEVEPLGLIERRRIFSEVLGVEGADWLAQRFTASADEARAAAEAALRTRRLRSSGGEALTAEEVSAQLLEHGARRMGRLVSRLRSGARLAQLAVPPRVAELLEEIVAYWRASARVSSEWGMRGVSPLGRGLACLFGGPPGTGKTFAAQCLANELGLNLYRIDLSQVVSKYIGETEKALAQVFDEAEAGHGVLLFDEADALFGKRSEVKDAHDRYANIEVGYLLQRIEAFEGVALLTTNLKGNLDPAFTRRLRFIIDFPMPDAALRRRIWEQSLPARARWSQDVDLAPLVERFTLSGGLIANIGVAAAHLAAQEPEGLVRQSHLVRATYRELEKAGLARTREDFGPMADLLPASAPAAPGAPVSTGGLRRVGGARGGSR